MTLELFVICDAATVSGGKLNILGAFDSICAAHFPVVHPQCTIAVRIRFSRIEEGEHRLRMNVVDEDGRAIVSSLDGTMAVKFGAEEDAAVANLLINLQNLKIERPGQYGVDLAVDGRHEASLPLFVREAKPQPQA